jgi:hypothetical protein
MNKELIEKARDAVYRPLPHSEKLYGWSLDSSKCFAKAGGYRRDDWGGHQCGKNPKYHIRGIQFCALHAKELTPNLDDLDEIKEPLYKAKYVHPKW